MNLWITTLRPVNPSVTTSSPWCQVVTTRGDTASKTWCHSGQVTLIHLLTTTLNELLGASLDARQRIEGCV